jgi:micrococcal nuclease
MKIYTLIFFLLSLTATAQCDTYHAVVSNDSIYDGDTFKATVDVGMWGIYKLEKIRIYGINTPEINGKQKAAALAARDSLRRLIPPATRIVLQYIDRDKYDRAVCIIKKDTLDVGRWMISKGLATRYLDTKEIYK